jgi:hypothetical protein
MSKLLTGELPYLEPEDILDALFFASTRLKYPVLFAAW